MATKEHEYGASDITVLEGLEAVRKRPSMYIGSTGVRGLHHLVWEIVDNSIDESLAGYCSEIEIRLLKDGSCQVTDNGRGIPVDIHPVEQKSTVEVVLTVLHAGGKFGGGGYNVSGGLHGVGSSVVNALSSKLHVNVMRQGFNWSQSFEKGGIPVNQLTKGSRTTKTGTSITFLPDSSIFETVIFDYKTLYDRFQQMAFLNKNLQIKLIDERNINKDPDEVIFKYENGLIDYVKYLNSIKKIETIHDQIIHFNKETSKISIEVAMQWTNSYSPSIYAYVNTINTNEGGTHEEGFRAAVTTLINRYARERKFLKDKDENLAGEDIREGLTAVISIKMQDPQFEGQTKTKLGNSEVRTFVQKMINEELADWLDCNPHDAKSIVNKGIAGQQSRLAARKAREATRRKTLMDIGFGMTGKLADCSSKSPKDCEIYVVEGDSAGGSAKQGRNPFTQAILPLRGKILNVERIQMAKALANKEVQAMITSLGVGVGKDFNIDKLRYHKIILMADADVDGQHITTLLLTLIFRYMNPLISGGYVYLAQPPLYRIKWTNAKYDYVYSDFERDQKIKDGQSKGYRLLKENSIQRYKGLGEMDYQELWDTTMNPDNRILKQVKNEDAVLADNIFSTLMGDNVEARRKFIQQNAKDVRFLSI